MNTITVNENSLLMPLEVIELEPEDFEQAAAINDKVTDEALRWQNYQNALALIGFEKWLKQRKPELQVDKSQCSILQSPSVNIDAVCNLKVNDLIVCLINANDLTEEFVPITKTAIDSPEFAAHFYVLTEVLEEQEQVNINGFVRYDQLNNYRESVTQTSSSRYYKLPLSLFNQPNQLLLHLGFLKPSAIPLPVKASDKANQSIVNLNRWLHGVFNTGWQAVETILKPSHDSELAFRFRDARNQEINHTENSSSIIKRAKLFNLGIEKPKSLILIVGFEALETSKFRVWVEINPTTNQNYLPQDLQLMVLDETGQAVMQAQTRNTNKKICLDFKGDAGERFSIKLVLGDSTVTEAFII